MILSPQNQLRTAFNELSSYCDILTEGVETKAFIDTGAGISLISDKFRQSSKYLKQLKLEPAVNIKAVSINEQPVDILGVVRLNVVLERINVNWSFYVAHTPYNILLGWDFITHNGVVIDAGNGRLRAKG